MTGFYFSRDFGFPELFGKVRDLKFNSVVKDLMPSYWVATDSGYKCFCKTLGINESDLKISLEEDCILVAGESEIDGYKYNTKYELPIVDDVLDHIKSITYKSTNGITVINLEVDKPEKRKVEIKRI